MGLRGKNVNVTLTKVGGEEEQTNTKLYDIRVNSQANRSTHSIRAVGIPCIRDDTAEVKIDHVAKRLGLEKAIKERKWSCRLANWN